MEIGVRGKDLGELERLLGLFESGKLSGPLTVARLLLVSRDVASIERWLLERVATCNGVRDELLHLIEQHRHGCQCVAALREGHAAEPGRERALGAVPPLAAPPMGEPDRAERVESGPRGLVEQLEAWGLLGLQRRTLELGCGTGRMQAALSARVAFAAGVDASPQLIARARWCSSRLLNARHEVAESHDLSAFGDASFQLVYAVDPVPSLVGSGDAHVASTLAEVARVLEPAGDFVVFELPPGSAADAFAPSDVARRVRDHGFELVACDERPSRCLTGMCFRMRRLP